MHDYEIVWIFWIVLWIVINAAIGYAIGKERNNIGVSVFISVLLGPIGWIIALISKEGLRKCPFCSESIKPDAKVCRYCGRDLPPIEAPE